jgi:hypothetical protein
LVQDETPGEMPVHVLVNDTLPSLPKSCPSSQFTWRVSVVLEITPVVSLKFTVKAGQATASQVKTFCNMDTPGLVPEHVLTNDTPALEV